MALTGDAKLPSTRHRLFHVLLTSCLVLSVCISIFAGSAGAYLFASKTVDMMITTSEILAIVSSGLSLIQALLHTLLIRRSRSEQSLSNLGSLQAGCNVLARLLVMLWLATAATGLVVAFKVPVCLPATKDTAFWNSGLSCYLHRASVAASILGFAICIALLCFLEKSESQADSYWEERSWEHQQLSEQNLLRAAHSYDIEKPPVSVVRKPVALGTSPSHPIPYPHPRPARASWGSGWIHVVPHDASYSSKSSYSQPQHPQFYSPTSSSRTASPRSSSTAPTSPALSAITTHSSMQRTSSRAPSSISSLHSAHSVQRRSPLSTMRRADFPDEPIVSEFRSCSGSQGDIPPVPRIPVGLGLAAGSSLGKAVPVYAYQHQHQHPQIAAPPAQPARQKSPPRSHPRQCLPKEWTQSTSSLPPVLVAGATPLMFENPTSCSSRSSSSYSNVSTNNQHSTNSHLSANNNNSSLSLPRKIVPPSRPHSNSNPHASSKARPNLKPRSTSASNSTAPCHPTKAPPVPRRVSSTPSSAASASTAAGSLPSSYIMRRTSELACEKLLVVEPGSEVIRKEGSTGEERARDSRGEREERTREAEWLRGAGGRDSRMRAGKEEMQGVRRERRGAVSRGRLGGG